MIITDLTTPGLVVAATLLTVVATSAESTREAVVVLTVSVVFAAVVPYLFMAWHVRRAGADRHVRRRQDRLPVLMVALASTAAGLALLHRLDAPRVLLALVAAMIAGLVVVYALTRRWKVSLHLAVATGAAVVVLTLVGWAAVALVPCLAAVGWARHHLRHHTTVELAMGAVAGAAAAALFPIAS